MHRIRLENEFRLQKACYPWKLSEYEYDVVECDDLDISITCSPQYPFTAPRLKGISPKGKVESIWIWFAVCARRKSNQIYLPQTNICTCCTSPGCEWDPRKRICDMIDYAACLYDVQQASIIPMPLRLQMLPDELLQLIIKHCF
jgi:hypothetical protein